MTSTSKKNKCRRSLCNSEKGKVWRYKRLSIYHKKDRVHFDNMIKEQLGEEE